MDLLDVGLDKLDVQVVHNDEMVESRMRMTGVDRHTVMFTPERTGIYTVSAFCGGIEIPGRFARG